MLSILCLHQALRDAELSNFRIKFKVKIEGAVRWSGFVVGLGYGVGTQTEARTRAEACIFFAGSRIF